MNVKILFSLFLSDTRPTLLPILVKRVGAIKMNFLVLREVTPKYSGLKYRN